MSIDKRAGELEDACYNVAMQAHHRRLALVLMLVGVISAVIVWKALPRMVAALPGQVRHYVPDVLVAAVTTPLPTALPAPVGPTPEIAALMLASPTAELRMEVPATVENDSEAVMVPTPTLVTPATPEAAKPNRPPYTRLDGLPIIPQKFNNCGPTNLTILLNYYGIDVDQFDVAAVIRPNYEDRNVSPDELAGFVHTETDLHASVYVGGDLELLRRLLAAGYPVIIEKGLVPDEATGWMGHYLTLVGYDDITGHFYVRDTYLGPWQQDGLAGYAQTETAWRHFNDTFILIYPPQQATEVAEILGPEMRDPLRMWQRAADRARLAIQNDPQDAFAWFNLGTSLTMLAKLRPESSDYESAAAAFDQARLLGLPPRMLWYQFAAYEAYLATGRYEDILQLAEATLASQGGLNVEETYLYQGRALQALGDADGAMRAFRRVIDLHPNSPQAALASAALEGTP